MTVGLKLVRMAVGYCESMHDSCLLYIGASGSKLDRRASQEAAGHSRQHSAAVRASQNGNGASPAVNRAASSSPTANNEKPATVSITLSADSAQRLKAQAAESGLHQSDSGLASESQVVSASCIVHYLHCRMLQHTASRSHTPQTVLHMLSATCYKFTAFTVA